MNLTITQSKNAKKLHAFYRRYIVSPVGWVITSDLPIQPNAAKPLKNDIIKNLPNMFRGRKKEVYHKKYHYHLTIFPFKSLSSFVYILFFPVMITHELTHVYSIKRGMSEKWLFLLPMVTELPFCSVFILNYFVMLPIYVVIPSICFGLIGLVSLLDGDFQSYLNYRKGCKTYPNLKFIDKVIR